MSEPQDQYFRPGNCVDSAHPDIVELATRLTDPAADDVQNTVALYYWVRDEIRYNPYTLSETLDDFRASATLAAGEGWCVPKAILLAALCRAVGIPARLGYADVRNHLSTARLRAIMQTDVFYFHGYTSTYLEGQWVKSTPAFNLGLCEKFGLHPLEFDGHNDSLYHPFDRAGNKHMEYLRYRGEFAELPFENRMAVFRQAYPQWVRDALTAPVMPGSRQWDADVARETGA